MTTWKKRPLPHPPRYVNANVHIRHYASIDDLIKNLIKSSMPTWHLCLSLNQWCHQPIDIQYLELLTHTSLLTLRFSKRQPATNTYRDDVMLNWQKIHVCILQLAIEAITNIRTVAGLGREKMFVRKYIQELDNPHVQVHIAKDTAKVFCISW